LCKNAKQFMKFCEYCKKNFWIICIFQLFLQLSPIIWLNNLMFIALSMWFAKVMLQ
jgi:hypothetical protein